MCLKDNFFLDVFPFQNRKLTLEVYQYPADSLVHPPDVLPILVVFKDHKILLTKEKTNGY